MRFVTHTCGTCGAVYIDCLLCLSIIFIQNLKITPASTLPQAACVALCRLWRARVKLYLNIMFTGLNGYYLFLIKKYFLKKYF